MTHCRPRVPAVLGPLAPHAAGFRERTQQMGYTPYSSQFQIWVMARLSQWMLTAEIQPEELTDVSIDQFLTDHREHGYKQRIGRRRLAPLLEYLRTAGLVPPRSEITSTPGETLLLAYATFLLHRRNLAPRTIEEHLATVRRFLAAWHPETCDPVPFERLQAADVTTFLLEETGRLSTGASQNVVNHLRSFLRFSYQTDRVARDFAVAIPPVASWHAKRLPPIIPVDQVEALIATCNRSIAVGRRDYAILLLLARLGLRASEVCRLTLDDIDWRTGQMVIHGKGQREDRMPLPQDVGEAVVQYLQDGRQQTTLRWVFLAFRAPLHGISRAGISHIVRQACVRNHLTPMGPHRLRHALASELLRQGVALPAIGQVLRHRDLDSTAVYAKVDRAALRAVTQPWPEVTP